MLPSYLRLITPRVTLALVWFANTDGLTMSRLSRVKTPSSERLIAVRVLYMPRGG